MKNIKYVVWTAIVVCLFGSLFLGGRISNWSNVRRNKKIAEDELKRLVNEFGLKKQSKINDLKECSFRYVLYEEIVKGGFYDMGEKKLKEKDIFMVNCIPIIRELINKCEAERKALDEKYPFEIREGMTGDKCERDVLNTLVIDK